MKLPRYFIGTYQDTLDILAGTVTIHGEWHAWHPTEINAPPTDPSFVIFRGEGGGIHPHWRAMPHLLDQTPIQMHFAPPVGQTERRAALLAAWAQTAMPITAADTTFSLAKKLHKQMKVFEP